MMQELLQQLLAGGETAANFVGNEFMEIGASGAEILSSPKMFAQSISGDRDVAQQFMDQRNRRRSQLPTFNPTQETADIQTGWMEPITSAMTNLAEKYPNEAQLASDLVSDPSIQALGSLVQAGEMFAPVSAGRAVKSFVNKPQKVNSFGAGTPAAQKGQITLGDPAKAAPDKIEAREFTGKKTKTAKNTFTKKLDEARASMPLKDRAQVSPFDPEDFSGTVYLIDDGTAGFTMDKNGYVGNVFKHPDSARSGTLASAMTKARGEGAINLDAFDEGLVEGYQKAGAKVTGRQGYSEEYATDEIIAAFGESKPDYVGMEVGGVFDEYKHSKRLGERSQAPMERYTTTPTGRDVKKPASIDRIFTPENIERVNDIAKEGIKKGGDKWYHTAGILDEFIDELGVDDGLAGFEEFMDLGAAVSPRSNVTAEIKRASYLRFLKKRGVDITDMDKTMFMPGYGHLATDTQSHGVNSLIKTGTVGDTRTKPKTPAYSENKKGNYGPVTVDGHNYQIWTGKKKSPSNAEYPHMENWQMELAEAMGIDPAEYQSAVWVGGKEITGVKDPRNYTAALNQRIAKTATEHGMTEEAVMKDFIKGDIILRALMGGVGTGTVLGGMGNNTEGEL